MRVRVADEFVPLLVGIRGVADISQSVSYVYRELWRTDHVLSCWSLVCEQLLFVGMLGEGGVGAALASQARRFARSPRNRDRAPTSYEKSLKPFGSENDFHKEGCRYLRFGIL